MSENSPNQIDNHVLFLKYLPLFQTAQTLLLKLMLENKAFLSLRAY
jgi:hypothetical protein